MANITVVYPENGFSEVITVEIMDGETPEMAIQERGYAQYEFRVISVAD